MASEYEVPYIPMLIDTDNYTLTYSKSNFNKGIKESSYMAGMITGLLNTGLEKDQVSEIICEIVKSGFIKAE